MITFRYRLKNVPMKIAEQSFTADGVTFPAGSFIISRLAADHAGGARRGRVARPHRGGAVRRCRRSPTHDGDVPRVAIYSQWSGTQELGWYRHAFDQFGIPFDLIFKERVAKGNLKAGLRRDHHGGAERQPRGDARAAGRASRSPMRKATSTSSSAMYGEHAGHERRLRRRPASTRSRSSSTAAAR